MADRQSERDQEHDYIVGLLNAIETVSRTRCSQCGASVEEYMDCEDLAVWLVEEGWRPRKDGGALCPKCVKS